MNYLTFLKDKLFFLIFNLVLYVIIGTILLAYHVSFGMVAFIFLVWFIPLLPTYTLDFLQKNNFYNNLQNNFHQLDHKYLLQTLIDEPDFLEGKLFYEILVSSNKAMHEEINHYQRELVDYREFIEMWVHEIKTPIAAAHMVITNRHLEKDLQDELLEIQDYVEQVLYYARSMNANKDYLISEHSLMQIVSTVLRRYAKTFIYNKIALSFDELDDKVYTDVKWAEFIISQIISNAIRYLKPQNPCIKIYTQNTENAVILTIEDTGLGISPKDLPHIFDKGFTGENGRINKNSTGLGLYLCKQLSEKLYIGLEVESLEHIGTKVHLIFPKNRMMLLD